MRLINADALHTHKFLTPQVKVIGGRRNGKIREQIIEAYQKGWNDCIDAIADNAPTVEKPQGEWIDQSEDYGYAECPFCHELTTCSEDNIDELHFCWNCGAELRKGGAE